MVTLGAAANPVVIPAYRLPKPPLIDGAIHVEDEWKGVPSVSGLYDETTNERASDDGTFWIAYDNDFVYVAARMVDSQPGLIRANQYQTNVSLQGDDYLQVDLDLSGSASDFNQFQANPKGATNMLLAGGRAAKREWAGEFEAAGRITPAGWELEMRIPWQAMKLPAAGPRDLRVNFERFVARTNRSFAVAYVNNGGSNNPIWRAVPVPGRQVDNSIKLLPYGYAGYDSQNGPILNAGMDMKGSIADQIQLVGSINPDFRNIENQILSLDFSRFQRLPGESRPFFLEGSQYIGSALFSSQLIPQFDLGLNSYGKISDKTSFGVLNTTQYGGPNDTVANATYAPDPDSSWRLGMTSMEGGGFHNEAYLVRYQKSVGPWSYFARDMGSQDQSQGFGDNDNASFGYNSSGFNMFGEYTRITPNFDPRLGFFPEVNLKGPDGGLFYDRPWNHGAWNDVGVSANWVNYQFADGGDYRRDADYQIFGTLRNGLNMGLERDDPQFEGSDDHLTTLSAAYPKGNPYDQVSGAFAWGREAGIQYNSLTLSDSRRIANRLQITGRYQMVEYGGPDDQTILDASYDLKHDMAVYGRILKQGQIWNSYLAFRRSGNLGTEYYLILGAPNSLTFHPSIILKVIVPLEIGGHHRSS